MAAPAGWTALLTAQTSYMKGLDNGSLDCSRHVLHISSARQMKHDEANGRRSIFLAASPAATKTLDHSECPIEPSARIPRIVVGYYLKYSLAGRTKYSKVLQR